MMKDFLTVQGNSIIGDDREEFFIKGIGFGNDVFGNPSLPPLDHHNEESFDDVRRLGLNTVRFLINYGLFEADDYPYQYKQSGFDWLDQNIEMAKKQGIRLILNMHRYFTDGPSQFHMRIWKSEECQNRLSALWAEIARRYAGEPAIAGYGLINEPVVPTKSTYAETIAHYRKVYNKMVSAIRQNDPNHIIFCERILGHFSEEKKTWGELEDGNLGFAFLDDDNVVYEFHNYDPFIFTHQCIDVATQKRYHKYPNENQAVNFTYDRSGVSYPVLPVCTESKDWQKLSSGRLPVPNPSYHQAFPVLRIESLNENDEVLMDDIEINEYDHNGTLTRRIYTEPMDTWHDWRFYTQNHSGSVAFSETQGHGRAGCISLREASGSGTIENMNMQFEIKIGHTYEIVLWIKCDADKPVDIWPGFGYQTNAHGQAYLMNKSCLEESMQRYVELRKRIKAPVVLGEFGCMHQSFEENRGGERWVGDMLDICNREHIPYSYHAYHEWNFGLYWGKAISEDRNQKLFNAFKEHIK